MRKFEQKQNQLRQKSSDHRTKSNALPRAAHQEIHPVLKLQRTIGNQAVLRLLRAKSGGLEASSHAEHSSSSNAQSETSTSNRTAPSIVHKVLSSPGEPLDAATRAFMEPRLGHQFDQIRIHTDTPAAKAAEALGAEAFTVGHHIAFARGRFRLNTSDGKRLVAHELTHAIQQAATFPRIALQPDKTRSAQKSKGSGVVGGLLGWTESSVPVTVTREVGGSQGYEDKLQAIAVARLAKADPAAVVQDTNKKWHAVEITQDFEAGPSRTARAALEASAEEDSPFLSVYGLPSLSGAEPSRQKVNELNARLAELNNRKTTSEEARKALEKETDQTRADLAKANLTMARIVLGVPEADIWFITSLSGRKAGKVNIMERPEKGSTGGAHAPLGGGTAFEEGLASALWIDLPELAKPEVVGTLFHEVSHLKDWELAQAWLQKYRSETKKPFDKSDITSLRSWLEAQVKKGRLTKADAEMVVMEIQDTSAYTEARVNVRTFLAALQAGDPDLASKLLVGYAHALKPGVQYAAPANGSEVQAALVAELKAAYRQMSGPMQEKYDAAVAAAKKENPSAWISELDFSKRK